MQEWYTEACSRSRGGVSSFTAVATNFLRVSKGNVEYKLKLTDISPARFARLVTQLKWRLLEGGGQAYYELGVADSGALIGLSRADLEQSLETLEMMAGEIGASVIVVKEIEVPTAMVALADKVSAYIDPETGKWTEKMSNKRFRSGGRGGETTASGIETEIETETDTDDSPSLLSTPDYPPVRETSILVEVRQPSSNPERPSSQSSPFIAPFDDDLALFSMEGEPEFDEDADADKENDATLLPADADVPDFHLDIEISEVYKPRPFRRRTPHPPGAGVFGGKQGRKGAKSVKEKLGRNVLALPAPLPTDASHVPNRQEAKALLRRQARDRRREEKRKALLAGAADLAAGLENLHVTVESADLDVVSIPPTPALTAAMSTATPSPALTATTLVNPDPDDVPALDAKEPRLIVEALVVRKMSLDEGYLDFGGFSVI